MHLHAKHIALQNQYGGQLVEPIHITVERFTPEDGQFSQDSIATIKKNLSRVQPFLLSADALIQFFAPYWQSQVLRWRVAETSIWNNFRNLLESTLSEIHCPSHFIRRRHASCTILRLDGEIDPSLLSSEISMPLFWVRELWISMLKADREFEILVKIELSD